MAKKIGNKSAKSKKKIITSGKKRKVYELRSKSLPKITNIISEISSRNKNQAIRERKRKIKPNSISHSSSTKAQIIINRKPKGKVITKNFTIAQQKKSNLSLISKNSKNKKQVVLLPADLLKKAKNMIKEKSLKELVKAMKVYDIDNYINYNYLKMCGEITPQNYKYIYTLSLDNRKDILKLYNIKNKLLKKSSIEIFYDLVNFLIKEPKNVSSNEKLGKYSLDYFSKFIIPISEGTEELHYFYFISIILDWIKNYESETKDSLSYFKDFFKKKENIYKADYVFYIIFRIDLIFFNSQTIEDEALIRVNLMVNDNMNLKIRGLKLIKNEIKENMNKIKIMDNNTILTLKSTGYKFKPFDYYYPYGLEKERLISNIIKKKRMTYSYCLQNKLNYFDNDKQKRAFFNYLKMIMKSKVIKEYFGKVESFNKYKFPLEDDKVINYLFSKLIFTELDANLSGMTNREGFGVFINRLKGEKINGLGFGGQLITISQEIIAHVVRNIINTNDGLEASTITPNESFINDEDNFVTNNFTDGGDKFEVILFGQKATFLTIKGNHYLFNIKNWNLSLEDFRKGFIISNNVVKVNDLIIELQELKNNDYIGDLFKDVNYNSITENIKSQSIQPRKSSIKIFPNKEFA